MQKERMQITIPYYQDNTRISNSNIGWFLKKGPAYLRSMLDGKEEGLKSASIDKGSMIHMWILQNKEFWDNYVILDFETPSSKQQQLFAEKLANTVEIEPDLAVLSAYRAAYSTNGLTDDKVLLKGLEMANTLSSYIEYLKMKNTDKTVISFADLNAAKMSETNVRKHKLANELLYKESTDSVSVYNEFHINWIFPKLDVECKSLIDRWMIDFSKKTITLVDIKTTVDVYNFNESMDKYDYYRQLAYYWMAIFWYMKNELAIDPFLDDEWSFETYIVAIQNNNKYEVRVFDIDSSKIEDRLDTIKDAIAMIKWHKDTNNWEYNKIYYDGNGSEQLKAS